MPNKQTKPYNVYQHPTIKILLLLPHDSIFFLLSPICRLTHKLPSKIQSSLFTVHRFPPSGFSSGIGSAPISALCTWPERFPVSSFWVFLGFSFCSFSGIGSAPISALCTWLGRSPVFSFLVFLGFSFYSFSRCSWYLVDLGSVEFEFLEMSSSSGMTTADFVPGRTLVVHVAENGHSFEFDCDGATLVDAIQRSIESHCGVPAADQLLLCGNSSLHPHQPLAHYKLPQDDREVFLYNKARLLADAARPVAEAIEVPEASIPPPPSPSRDPHPLDDAADPALKALASYERGFRYHFQTANARYGAAQAKFEVCKRLLREQQVQERALDTARGNLEHTYQRLQQRYDEFLKCYTQQHRGHSELLGNFKRDVERLRSVKLHPLLQSKTRRCLLDFVKEDELRKWAEVCFNSHQQFEGKVSQLKQKFRELNKRVKSAFAGMSSGGSKELEVEIKERQKTLNNQKSIMQSLSKDVNTVKRHVDDYLSSQLSASVRPHDAVSALGPMYEAHEKNLLEVQRFDNATTTLLDKCKGKKNDTNLLVHVSMQNIKSVQFGIKDMINELHAFQEVMGHQEKEFENLKYVNGVGYAYRASLAEVVRRKSSFKLYMGLAGQLAERLATEREAELRKREGFYRTWSRYIPHDILASMGLLDSPSQCDVNISPFDTNLLEIDVADVDRFAPQFSTGSLSKFEGNESPKTSFDLSTELLEGSESVNIAGTSKMEVENARLKAELASAISLICVFNAEIGYDSLDEGKLDNVLRNVKEKNIEALRMKDEYGKHLKSMLEMKQAQCLSYEKRIQELEQKLSDPYMQGQKFSSSKDASESGLSATRSHDGYKSEILGDGETNMPFKSTVSMDDASCSSTSMDPKLDDAEQPGKPVRDENMIDLSGSVNMQDSERNFMDASMLEQPRDEHQVSDMDEQRDGDISKDQVVNVDKEMKTVTTQLSLTMTCSDVSTGDPLNMSSCETNAERGLGSKGRDNLISELQSALAEKSNQCDEIEEKLKAAMEEICSGKRELEINRNLLDESQMNCAHLENCLHEAREEAHTNLCAAERRASEYNALRTDAVRMRGLFERFRNCITASVPVATFADSLTSFAVSLASAGNDDEDDSTKEFRACIKVLADKVGSLSQRRTELLERLSRAETANGQLVKKLEEKDGLITSLYTKHQLEKQANKEKICFARFEVHELAAFILKPGGHYEAINRGCSRYFLSAESVALFTEHQPRKPTYIVGQIVHIERQTVRAIGSMKAKHGDQRGPPSTSDSSGSLSSESWVTSNLFGLPTGCEYFIVTVAMLPDTILSSPS